MPSMRLSFLVLAGVDPQADTTAFVAPLAGSSLAASAELETSVLGTMGQATKHTKFSPARLTELRANASARQGPRKCMPSTRQSSHLKMACAACFTRTQAAQCTTLPAQRDHAGRRMLSTAQLQTTRPRQKDLRPLSRHRLVQMPLEVRKSRLPSRLPRRARPCLHCRLAAKSPPRIAATSSSRRVSTNP